MWRPLFLLLAVGLLGLSWGLYRVDRLSSWHLPDGLIKKPIHLTGRIISVPKVDPLAAHFDVETMTLAGQPVSTKVHLSWYGQHPALNLHDQWEWVVKLKPAHRLHNFGNFAQGVTELMSGIRATGYVDSKRPFHLIARKRSYQPMEAARTAIQQSIVSAVNNPSIKAIIVALSTGSRACLTSDEWEVLQKTETSHLVAISGLHVGFVSGLIYGVVYFFWRFFPSLILWVSASCAASWVALISAVFYGFLAGFSLPTQRAVLMIVVLMLSHIFYRNIALSTRLMIAFMVIFIWQPLVLFSASFYLSFFAVMGMAYSVGGRLKALPKKRQWVRAQVALFVILGPLTLYFFQQLSWVGFIANAVAIPWVGFLIVPLCFLASLLVFIAPSWSAWVFHLTSMLFMPLWKGLLWLASLPHITWQHPLSEFSLLWLSLAAGFWLLAPRGWPGRWLGWVALLPICFYRSPLPEKNNVWLTALDVGQGLSVLIQTAHHTLLYDTGPHFYGGFDAGKSVILPYFRWKGIRQIDTLVVSHGDNDHSGGAKAVLNALPVKRFLTSDPQKFRGYSAHFCYSGQRWNWDGVAFKVLWPAKGSAYAANNSSCVLRISRGKESILLTGDIERPVEERLVKAGVKLGADFLVAPHHGSRTSSSVSFLEAVNPKAVIFSDGYYNRYGHPSPEIARRYRLRGVQVFDTSRMGAISLHLTPDGRMESRTARDEQGGWRW